MKLVGVAATAAILFGLWKAGEAAVPRYHVWKQSRALKQAKQFIDKRDAPNAQLALEVAIREVPGNPDTIRVAADMLEQVNAPQAMRLRRAVVQVLPDSAEDAAALVMCCLKFRDINAARDALGATPPLVSGKAPMVRAALAFALMTDNAPVADALFKQLGSQVPEDPELKVAHSLLLLRHPKEEIREAARRDLEAAATVDPKLRYQIDREFAAYALQRKDYQEAGVRLAALVKHPQASFNDHLQKANLELLVEKKSFEPIFAELSGHAAKDEASAIQFTQWLLVQNRSVEADQWIQGLPLSLLHTRAVQSGHAEAIAQLKEWDKLEATLLDGAWGQIAKETLHLAFAAHTVDTPSRPALRRETWELAIGSAGTNLSALAVLQRLAATWQWEDELEQTLWATAKLSPDQTWVFQTLFNIYRHKKNTAGMRDVMAALKAADGAVPRYQHDWALLTLLMEPTAAWTPVKETMRKLYESDPSDPSYATGYAFALAQSGKGAPAFDIIVKVPLEQRDQILRQPYLAFVYGVAKKSDDFAHAVKIAEGTSYLSEEAYLFTRGREELEKKPIKPKDRAPNKS